MRVLISAMLFVNFVLLGVVIENHGTERAAQLRHLPVPPAPLNSLSARTSETLADFVMARLNDDPFLSGYDPDRLDPQTYCLAQAVYFEARSEPLSGQLAVAQVVLNRVKSPAYPDTVCGVVFQNQNWRHRCQFSFACDGLSDKPYNRPAWAVSATIAEIAKRRAWDDLTHNATHYHADYVQPRWRLALTSTVRHGRHLFYRDEQALGLD